MTAHEARAAGAFPELADIPASRLPGDKNAFKHTLWHQLAVARTHLVFLGDARRQDDAYGPFEFIRDHRRLPPVSAQGLQPPPLPQVRPQRARPSNCRTPC